jgi:predicted ATPase/DNA-binding SARP family transcriptional activator
MFDHEPSVRLRVLGTTRVEHDGELEEIPSARQRTILAVLAAAGGRAVSADVLIDALRGDRLPAHPLAALHTQLTRVRQVLGPAADALRTDRAGYSLALGRSQVDAWHFEDLVGMSRPERRNASALSEALSLWAGDPFSDADGHPFVEPVAVRLVELRWRGVEELAWARLETGVPDAALAAVDPLLVDDPFRERARAVELRALYAAGRATEALSRYQDYRRRLAEELGLEPSPLLQQIEHDILDHQLPLEPVRFAPDGGPPVLPVSSFLGRHRDLQSVSDQLARARVVTIVGPGGVGKTRLALHAAHEARDDYPDGVWWCDLVSASPGEVTTVVAARLGVQERSGEAQVERLAAFLGNRRLLLVLDNCEHVVADACRFVDTIVRRGPALDVLATSRQPLGVDGEHQIRLGPLALPGGNDASSAAVELFLDRAQAVAPDFQPCGPAWSATVELCRKVGGLPLAIELAAASIARIDVGALADRIGDHLGLLDRPGSVPDDRHRSLTKVLESCCGLLDPDERALLDRLSVFAGPFTLDDAEALDDQSGEPYVVDRLLGGLVEKSMLLFRPTDGRYELLPPVQALCRSRLAAAGERDRRRAQHANLVVEKARRTDRALQTREELRFSAVFDDALAELRSARAWLVQVDDRSRLVDLSASTHWFAMLRNRSEVYRWAEDALVGVGQGARHPGVGRVRACAAHGAAKRGNLPAARRLAQVGAETSGDERRFCVEILGQISLFEGRLDDAITCSKAAAGLHIDAGDRLFATNAATVEAVALAYSGHLADAETKARQLRRVAAGIGVPSMQAMTSYILAETIADPAAAAAMYQESISLASAVGAEFVSGLANTSLAAREIRAGYHQRARWRLGGVIDHWQRAGIWNQQWLAIRLLIEALDRDGEVEPVAILTGAYAAFELAGPAYGEDAARLADAANRARLRLGAERYAASQRHGATLTGDETAAFARSLTRRSPT